MVAALVNVDLGIAETVGAIDKILARIENRKLTAWNALRDQLDATARAVTTLDDLYLALLTQTQTLLRAPRLQPSRIRKMVHEGNVFLHKQELLGRLHQLRGSIRQAAYHRDLNSRRHRELATILRSLDERLDIYGDRLRQIRERHLAIGPSGTPRWDLRGVVDQLGLLLDANATPSAVITACEEALWNYDRELPLGICTLIGRAQQQLVLVEL